MKKFSGRSAVVGLTLAILAAIGLSNAQIVSQVVNTVAVGGITGLGTGVAALLAGTSSGTVGLVGTTSPTLVTPVLGVATATSINGVTIDNNAWTPYTPTVSCGSGTITSLGAVAGRYKQSGKTVVFAVSIAVTTLGTCATNLVISAPVSSVNALAFQILSGMNSTSGVMIRGAVANNSGNILVQTYNALIPIGSGESIFITGTYEAS